jgi:hypothetical protein
VNSSLLAKVFALLFAGAEVLMFTILVQLQHTANQVESELRLT